MSLHSLSKAVIAIILTILAAAPAFPADLFRIGVAPHTSARVIIEQYQPLRLYLQNALGVEAEIITAPDFTEFARRALNQQYDIAITTGHQARLLQTDANYLPLLTYKTDFTAQAIVALDGPIKRPKDLVGTHVLGLSPTSLVTLWGIHWLKNNSIKPENIEYVSAADSVAKLVIANSASAGFVSSANFDRLAPTIKSQLRVLAESQPLAGRVYMLNSRHSSQHEAVLRAVWKFSETPQAKQYFEKTNLSGYRSLRPGELEAMDPYAEEVRTIIRQAGN